MPNKQVHTISAAIPLAIIVYFAGFTIIGDYLIHVLVYFAGTYAPDIIEYPYSWDHRAFFHSWFILKAFSVIFAISIVTGLVGYDLAFFVSAFSAGYIVHLLMDATTPDGLQ